MVAKGDRLTTKVQPFHAYALLNTGNVIRQCYLILLLFLKWL